MTLFAICLRSERDESLSSQYEISVIPTLLATGALFLGDKVRIFLSLSLLAFTLVFCHCFCFAVHVILCVRLSLILIIFLPQPGLAALAGGSLCWRCTTTGKWPKVWHPPGTKVHARVYLVCLPVQRGLSVFFRLFTHACCYSYWFHSLSAVSVCAFFACVCVRRIASAADCGRLADAGITAVLRQSAADAEEQRARQEQLAKEFNFR